MKNDAKKAIDDPVVCDHGPSGHHHHGGDNIAVAFWLNFSFTIVEFIGGFYTNSIAILSDALHDLGDSLSLGLAWYFEKVSKKGRDKKFTFGYKRFSIIGAIINSVILIVGSIFIFIGAISRFKNPEPSDSVGMMLMAILGIIINGLAVYKMQKGQSLNEKAVYLHLLEDVLGWVAVLIGAIIIHYTNWYWIDPFLSVLIALFILFNVYKNIKSAMIIILQATPIGVSIDQITKKIMEHSDIIDVHHIHLWSLDGQKNVLTAHLIINKVLDVSEVNKLRQEVKNDVKVFGVQHCTIEIELEGMECMDKCID